MIVGPGFTVARTACVTIPGVIPGRVPWVIPGTVPGVVPGTIPGIGPVVVRISPTPVGIPQVGARIAPAIGERRSEIAAVAHVEIYIRSGAGIVLCGAATVIRFVEITFGCVRAVEPFDPVGIGIVVQVFLRCGGWGLNLRLVGCGYHLSSAAGLGRSIDGRGFPGPVIVNIVVDIRGRLTLRGAGTEHQGDHCENPG